MPNLPHLQKTDEEIAQQKELEEKQMAIVAEKCAKFEQPLTEEELKMDLSEKQELDLGDAKNYKTKLLQNRWS